MFSFRWKTIEKCVADNDSLSTWELTAVFRGSSAVDELNIDRDAAIEHYISEQLPEENREDYRAEPQMAEDEMFDVFFSDLTAMVAERIAALGPHYPLMIDENGRLTLKPAAEISATGGAYLGLQFYRAWSAGLIEIEEPDDAERRKLKDSFNRWFPKLFEIIAGYAVSGHHAAVPHITAHCRSSLRLHKMLTRLCANAGAGRPKRYEDWSLEQVASNDGGIDCIAHHGGPGVPGNSYFVLVGATVQTGQINNKIVDADSRRRFSDYFAIRPAAFQGALVRPSDSDELTIDKCRVRDCLLYTYEEIWRNLGNRPHNQATAKYFARLDARARTLLRALDGATLIDGFDHYRLAAA
jgi:hypothetical protein